MKEGTFTTRLGYRLACLRIRRYPLYDVDIARALADGGKALVCVPDDEASAMEALSVCDRLSEWFSPVEIILLSRGTDLFRLPPTKHSVLAVPAAINRLGLPYRQVAQRAREIRADAAFDLHPTFNLASAYLCVLSGASLRAGFHAPDRGFFNLNYRWPRDDAPLASHYDRFLEFLRSLRASVAPGSSGK